MPKLENLRIVLVETSHPGNIGATARAMKTMGLSQLYLVSPKDFPHQKAIEMASNADDVLEQAIVVNDLNTAIADCGLVVGTSARSRNIPWPMLSPREFAERTVSELEQHNIALVLGRESSGLNNDELQRCHFHIQIPSNPNYSSLNLAAAVQVLAYEVYIANQKEVPAQSWDYPYATAEANEQLYNELEQLLIQIKFLNPKVPRQLMPRIRRLFNRARLDVMEMNILRGIIAAVKKSQK